MAKIYTKVGDKGETALVGGQKTRKDDKRIEAYGTIDELNSVLGVARATLGEAACLAAGLKNEKASDGFMKLNSDLEILQHWLFDLGSLLASLPEDRVKFKLTTLSSDHIKWLEERIDAMAALLPPLRNFILPGGNKAAAELHIARAVARRAERCCVGLGADLPENALPFINRLSDYFFTVARYANHLSNTPETLWRQAIPASFK